ncbi:putative Ferric iron uptake protein [Nitrospira japonica]|uniref:Putative Ferric iron uptake protein n=1 Tax=Nitrospira japonica TaxID=1325564 RepID=A0A1W1IAQ5_9BACT|nr:TonB-dependent receptor [Nitrospira japonica]SLM50080.1 putative Ferric iron uptake protein [Nitrospira japonica]
MRRLVFRALFVLCSLSAPVATGLGPMPVYAQSHEMGQPPAPTARAFNIEAQPLGAAIAAFAATTRYQVLYGDGIRQDVPSHGVQGTFTPEAALDRLLEGTGVTYRFIDATTFTLEQTSSLPVVVPLAAAGAAGAVVMADGASSVSGDGAAAPKPVRVPEVVVKDVRTRDDTANYVAEDANTATRTDTPIIQVPQSIAVVTQNVIQDQRAVRVEQALRNVSGVALGDAGQSGIAADVAYCRGFPCGYFKNYLRNDDQNQALTYRDVANMQRIEVLKGPASVLYGRSEPGGIVNILTKQPQADRYASIDQIVGSYNYYRTMIDVTGPLDEGKKLLFRVNGAYENSESFRDYVHGFRYFVAPVFTWKASNHTTISVEGEYIRDRRTPDSGLPAIGTGVAPVPDTRFYGEPFDTMAFEEGRAALSVLHQFNDAWRIESRFRADMSTATAARTVPLAVLGNQSLARFFFNQLAPISSYYWRNDVIGKLSTGSIKHEILTGAELGRQYASYNQAAVPFDTVSIFNPVYNQTPEPNLQRIPFSNSFANALGGYVQDQISLPYNFHVLVGARGDYFYQHSGVNGVDTKAENYAFSPRVGMTYQPWESFSVYANFTRSFQPNFGPFTAASNQFDPTRGTQYEAGVKSVIVPGRLTSTLAVYRIDKTNVLAPDPVNPLFFIQTGAQRSQGVEFDLTAQLAEGWKVIATYAYTDARVTEDTRAIVGNRLPLVARNTGSFWTTYDFQVAPLKGFGVGAGIFAAGERAGDLANTFELPGYVRTDAALYYRKPEIFPHTNLIAQLNAQNLLNQDYFYSGGQSRAMAGFPGAPLTFLGSIKLEFY